jgi:penicillin-binding protein 1A
VLEAILALQIEKRFSKEEILEMYLNQIFLGHGCYGVSSASRLFFDKRVMFLTAAESSVLAALPSAPGRYSPFRNAHNAYAKNRDILGRMVREGYLTEKQAEKIYREFWPGFIESIKTEYPTVTVNTRRIDRAPYFTDYVQQILASRYGKDVLYNEGLNVYTTLDLHRQTIAERVLREGVARQNITSANANQYSVSTTVDRKMFTTYYILRALFNLPEIVRDDSMEIAFRNAMVDEVIDAADALALFGGTGRSSIALQYFRSGMAMEVSTNLKVEGALIAVETKNRLYHFDGGRFRLRS